MPTRRFVIVSSIAATALLAAGLIAPGRRRAQAAPAPGPTSTARCLARYLQTSLPHAKLDDVMTEKIAGDIDGFLTASASFRNRGLRNSDEPDFVFSPIGACNR